MLRQPLGHWTQIPKGWEYYAVPTGDNLILHKKTNEGWVKFPPQGRSKVIHRFKDEETPTAPPPLQFQFPVTVKKLHTSIIMDKPTDVNVPYVDTEFKKLNTWWLHWDQLRKGSKFKLSEAIKQGQAVAVSDGSYSEKREKVLHHG